MKTRIQMIITGLILGIVVVQSVVNLMSKSLPFETLMGMKRIVKSYGGLK